MDDKLFKKHWQAGATRPELMERCELKSLTSVTYHARRLGLSRRKAGAPAATKAERFKKAWLAGKIETDRQAQRFGYASMTYARQRARRMGLTS